MLRKPQLLMTIIGVILLMALLPLSALAGTDSSNDGSITLDFPDDMVACEPIFEFSTSELDPTWGVEYKIAKSEAGKLTWIGEEKVSGTLNVTFTPEPLADGESYEYVIFVHVWDGPIDYTQPTIAKLSGKWNVVCEKEEPTKTPTPKTPTPTPETPTPTPTKPTPTPTPSGGEGCTPGYWRQAQHFDSWVDYAPNGSYDSAFGVDGSFDTLLDAVWARGGRENALARHAVAALLNATSPDVDYAYSGSQIIEWVQDAYASGDFEPLKDRLDEANNAGCPLN